MNLLPQSFTDSILDLLLMDGCPQEADAFAAAQNQPSARGLRANTLRVNDRDTLNQILAPMLNGSVSLEPVAWSNDGLYYPAKTVPAGLVAYHAGLFYIQEPSAMLPAELLGARPGERILDLCAAPGGKSCRIAADLAGEGLLWANDISADRIRPLIRNLELMGCTNAIVSEESPDRLATAMPAWFDRVLVDAPCSGAGMIRRDSRALNGFRVYDPAQYVANQAQILSAADRLLRPGGVLVYSTCTFSAEENEYQIADFLAQHPNYQQMPVLMKPGLSQGLPVPGGARIGYRIWPHRANGDGHFCAVLIKSKVDESTAGKGDGNTADEGTAGENTAAKNRGDALIEIGARPALSGLLDVPPAGFIRFLEDNFSETGKAKMLSTLAANLRLHEGHLHGLPLAGISAGGLRVLKTGLYLGDLRQPSSRIKSSISILDGSFTPSHALSHVLVPSDLRYVVSDAFESLATRKFIRGETLLHPNPESLPPPGSIIGIAADQYLLGFAQQMPDGHLKNLYPPAWRKHS